MTRSEVQQVLDRVRTWPEHRQEDLAHIILEMERHGTDVYVLSEEERADLEESVAQADRGEFATEEEIAALLRRYR